MEFVLYESFFWLKVLGSIFWITFTIFKAAYTLNYALTVYMSIYTFSALKTRLMYKLLYILIYISRNNVFLLRNDDLYSIYTYSYYIEFDQDFF